MLEGWYTQEEIEEGTLEVEDLGLHCYGLARGALLFLLRLWRGPARLLSRARQLHQKPRVCRQDAPLPNPARHGRRAAYLVGRDEPAGAGGPTGGQPDRADRLEEAMKKTAAQRPGGSCRLKGAASWLLAWSPWGRPGRRVANGLAPRRAGKDAPLGRAQEGLCP